MVIYELVVRQMLVFISNYKLGSRTRSSQRPPSERFNATDDAGRPF